MDTRKLIEAYHKAWTCGDFAAARSFLADDLDFQGSMEQFSNADDFLAALKQFALMTTRVLMQNGFFDKEGAALLYDCETATPAGLIRTAEFFTVSGNRIKAIRLVFDATDLRKAMQA
ncbi:nuclear transport factor 2 family protein [Chlorobium sp. KB01]|uniref:nuclear transport factor 2 family protein n=1 Tax=Chlorobium sp. KB01 TaxID=1917528 RepID=UPI00097554F2|nr:nuclear transport factor 2 family protein [Chlorobium sp. KB01]